MHYAHVFGDVRAFAQCHAATVLRRADGSLFLAWFGGTHEGHRDTAIWGTESLPSDRFADALTASEAPGFAEPRILAKASEAAHWNPVLFAPTESEFVLHFKVGARIRDWVTWSQRSSDSGATWQRAEPLVPLDLGTKSGRGGRGAVKNKPIRLRSGEWLAGASTETWRRWDAFVDRSPDGFSDWHASPPFPIDHARTRGKGVIQPTLWQSSEDDIHALLRSTEGFLYRSDSRDNGRSWSVARPTSIPNNNSGVDAVRLENGWLALACNPVEGNWAERSPLSILFSRDNGETWPERIDIESGPGEFSYPALIQDGEGLCVAFTWNRRRIAVARMSARELPTP